MLGNDFVELFYDLSVSWQFNQNSALPRPWRNDVKMGHERRTCWKCYRFSNQMLQRFWLSRHGFPQISESWFNHCTMALSIEIEDFQVLKSKCLVFAQFWSKSNNSFFDWCKTVNILLEKYFFTQIWSDIWHFWQNLNSWTDKPAIFHEDRRGQL